MIVNHTHKFIYIHIPKTGGSSLERRLINTPGSEYRRPPHGSIRDIESCQHFTFTTLRDPIEWYVSFYSDRGSSWAHKIYSPKAYSFEEWLTGLLRLDLPKSLVKKRSENIYEDALDYKFHLALYNDIKPIKGAGWLTHLFIYSCCKKYRELFEMGDIDIILDCLVDYLDVDVIVETQNLDQIDQLIAYEPLKILLDSTELEHENKSVHSESGSYYSDSLLAELKEREKLVYFLLKQKAAKVKT